MNDLERLLVIREWLDQYIDDIKWDERWHGKALDVLSEELRRIDERIDLKQHPGLQLSPIDQRLAEWKAKVQS